MIEAERSSTEKLYLEDLHPGMRFTSPTHEVDEAQMKSFAAAFDPQPFHLDEAAARASVFGGLAASGWYTAAVTMRLNVVGGLPLANGIVGLGGDLAWPAPVRSGDVLQVVNEIAEVTPSRSRPDRGTIAVHGETRNQRGEVVQRTTMKLLVPRRPV